MGTNFDLKTTKISYNDLCRICHEQPETLVYLFAECKKVSDLWTNIKQWIELRTNIHMDWTKTEFILGYSNCDANFFPFNFILMITRQYIFKCALQNRDVYHIQFIAKEKYCEQKLLYK